jgi:hypothetical protein
MPTSVLLKDGSKYGGKYVATRSFKNNEVLSSGKDPIKVLEAARKKARNPVIFYVPIKGMVSIY